MCLLDIKVFYERLERDGNISQFPNAAINVEMFICGTISYGKAPTMFVCTFRYVEHVMRFYICYNCINSLPFEQE